MTKIEKGYIFTSAAFPLKTNQIRYYIQSDKTPEMGDVVYGRISKIGQHSNLENKSGRIHQIQNGTRALFVYGNRYAPDSYEAYVPEKFSNEIDLVSPSGLIAEVHTKNSSIKDPTKIKIFGYLSDQNGDIINIKNNSLLNAKVNVKKFPRSKMILVCGTSMNSGKSVAAASICWTLTNLGYKVKGSKITGTASLKDILHMNDAGADEYSDFTFVGYPSTYLLEKPEILEIFNNLDIKYGSNPQNYWVVELADGINQRETEILLKSSEVRKRIHRLVFCANDTFGAIGGVEYLNDFLDLCPDVISGICTSSPLYMKELRKVTKIPIFDSLNFEIDQIKDILI